ncbi:MAG: homocysteine S-methyltransferase family protein [Alphaproteobacteria bacterium]|nr:MAG: homocysteine S-methyltransferase family protein [Alphaproteobacteria bacterium]
MSGAVTILDGGMGQQLVARCPEPPSPLWATQYMIDHPEVVRAIHDDYFAAGAQVATTNTYAIHHDRLERAGIDDRFAELHRMACELAVAARDAHGAGLVAGSMGPLAASYVPELAPPPEEAAGFYAEIAALHAPFVDLHLIETMAGIDQARGALMGLAGASRPVWLGLSVDDADGTRLRSGEPLAEALPLIAEFAPAAVLLNCSTPEAISQGLAVIARAGIPFGAYANGFTAIAEEFRKPGATVDALTARTDLTPQAYAEFAAQWVAMGASLVGGCCETGPAHIAAIAARLTEELTA